MSCDEMLKAITEYKKHGWVVHPLSKPSDNGKSPGKRPLAKEWQKLEKTPDDIEKYIKDGCNIGLVCGKASNVTVLDFDHKLFMDDVFAGIDTTMLSSSRTAGRGHVYFKYRSDLTSQKMHELGIEILTDGNNAVLPPSVHKSGDTYHWLNPDTPIIDMPDTVKDNLLALFQTYIDLKKYLSQCRACFKKVVEQKPNMHGAEGRLYMIAVCAELKSKGATEQHIKMFAKLMYGKDYDGKRTLEEWNNIDPAKTWKCDTLREKLPTYVDFERCAKCEKRNEKKGRSPTRKELPPIPVEEVNDIPCDINELETTFKKWLYIEEKYNLTGILCGFLGNYFPGDPDIIGDISPSGSTKTEFVRCFGESENQYCYPISSLTEHTFVSGHDENIDTIPLLRGRPIVIKDLTTLLSKKEEVRSGVFADFREMTDGYIRKEFGNGVKKEYRNIHSSVIFASTNAIERYYSMYSNLGQRMIFMRPRNDPVKARQQAEKNRSKKVEMRNELHTTMMRFLKTQLTKLQTEQIPVIPDEIKDNIGVLCDFLAIARTTIHHDMKGNIDELPEPEFPTRIASTLYKMAEIHAFIHGRKEANEVDQQFANRIIYDNIPTIRMQVLKALSAEFQTTSVIANKSDLPTPTAKRILDEMAALKIVVKQVREEKDDTQDKRSDSYRLAQNTIGCLQQLTGVIRYGDIPSENNNANVDTHNTSTLLFNILNKNQYTYDIGQSDEIVCTNYQSHPSINQDAGQPGQTDGGGTSELIDIVKGLMQKYGNVTGTNKIDFVKYCWGKQPPDEYTPEEIEGAVNYILKDQPQHKLSMQELAHTTMEHLTKTYSNNHNDLDFVRKITITRMKEWDATHEDGIYYQIVADAFKKLGWA